jgi:hypothetical protein
MTSAAESSGAPQRHRIGIRERQRMQRRIHVPGIDREETHAIDLSLFSPDCRQMEESSLARAVCAHPE